MQKKIVPFIIAIIFVIITLNGCIEKSPANHIEIGGKGIYTSIQDAIDAASEGDTIHVSGVLYDETIVINKSISLIGDEKNKTIIEYKKNVEYNGNENGRDTKIGFDIIWIKADNCTISGFKIIGNNLSWNLLGIRISSQGNTISDNNIFNFDKGIYLDSKAKGNTISNNTISNNKNGVYLNYGTSNNILSNKISSNSEYGILIASGSYNNLVSRNIVSNNSIGIRVKGKYNHIFRNKITDNEAIGVYVCCGGQDNHFYNNSFITNNLHATDPNDNNWDYHGFGNYWDDYEEKYPHSKDEDNDGIWDTEYIVQKSNKDHYPLIEPFDI